jgi:ribosomal protein S4
VHLPALLQELEFAPSRGAARRLVDQGAVKLGGVVVRDYDVPAATLAGQVLAAGRRRQVRLIP